MASFDEFYASLDPDVRVRGKQFEKFVKWFLKTDPTWASQIDEVWLWNEYPRRWGADCGIDLIFSHKNGKIWAVQSKCVSPNNDIKKSEIDSFLSESNDSRIDGRLLIASTDGIGKNALQVINRQEKQVICFLLEQFRKSQIEFPSSMRDLITVKKKIKKHPRPHQIEAIESVVEGLKLATRGQVLMACGTGKTLTSLWIKEALMAKQVLVLLPSLSLLSQTLLEWNAEANDSFKWICVCSDKSVAKDKSEDQWISNISEIGVPVTNDPLEIKQFIDESGSKVIFSTYQSSLLIVEAQEFNDSSFFDLVIADEAHRCAGKVSDAFGSVLDENKIKAYKRLFFTATPRILSSQLKKSAIENEIDVVSMDDYSVFGKILHQIKFSQAIEKDLLSDYQVVVVGIDDETIRNQILNRDLLEISSNGLKTDAETLASHIALSKAIEEYDLNRMITFHGLIKGAKNFAEDHLKVNQWMTSTNKFLKPISTAHVSGGMNSSERNKRINKLRNLSDGQRQILTNARCLSEGVDVPSLDGIAFIDPKQSQVDIVQAVGRAIRKSEQKSFGTIVIPVYLSEITENISDQVLASKFSNVWKIILALKSQDDSLMEEIDTLRVRLGERGGGGGNQTGFRKVVIDLPEKVSLSFVDRLRTILVQNTSEDWLEKFGELKRFAEENGHASPEIRHPNLGRWTTSQRDSYDRGTLSKERIGLLESIDFIWHPLEEEWNQNFENLKIYLEKSGNASPEVRHPTLGGWVGTQRRTYKSGKLSQERVDLLESIGFIWDLIEEEWNQNFQKLKTYADQNGNVSPPRTEQTIGGWVAAQRSSYRQGKLSKEKIELLEEIQFIWDPIIEEWNRNYQILKQFVEENGKIDPAVRHPTLGGWVNMQRKNFRTGKLSQERIKLLEDIGFVWDAFDSQWQNNFDQYKKFVEETGNVNPPKRDFLIGRWVCSQRGKYKKGKLNKKQIQSLESIGMIWDPLSEEWNNKFQELKNFAEENGTANPLRSHPTLGTWSNNQRQRFKRGQISQDRIALLENIGFQWVIKE